MPGIVPRFTETPGAIRWVGPELGAHNNEVFGELLGYSKEKIAALKEEGAI
jgi:formyl-CoA transferase